MRASRLHAARNRGEVFFADKIGPAKMMITAPRPAAARTALLIVGLITPFAAVASTSPPTVAASGACLALVVLLLWRGDEPPILLLPALFQWSEVALPPLSTIWRQVPLMA